MSAVSAIVPGTWRLPLFVLFLTISLLFAVLSDTAVSMVSLWQAATTYNHCFLVLPIALVLVWLKRDRLAALEPREERLALLPLAAMALLWLIGRAGQIQLFEHVALIGMIICLTLALLGREIAKVIAFPLGFLLFMVPFGDVFVPGLQQFTADFSVALLRLADIPVFRDGIMIETPSGLFEVAEACAGIRFLIANVMIGALFSYLALGRPWKWALFMAIAVILPIIANGLRAFGIILIAYLTDNEYAAGVDHLIYGWGFFALIMLTFLAIGNAIADWPSSSEEEVGRSTSTTKGRGWHPAMAVPAILLIAAAPLYAANVLSGKQDGATAGPHPMPNPTLALDLGPACAAKQDPSDEWRPSFAHADFIQSLKVDCGSVPVDLAFAYYARERDGVELVQHDNRLADGENWTRIAASWHRAKVEGLPKSLRKEELYGRENGDRVVLAWYWVGGKAIAKDWQAKAYGLYRKLLGKNEPAALIALSAAYADHPDEALPAIEAVLRQHKGINAYLQALAPKGQ